ncbi:hypothetical protein GCM10010172_05500 [Paractinoplanes ferrugineus]|uniref:Uncharacterized protein n=1 Tax=Paractinoplanes ferrugineus TaxID=113564 RepID=A0A919J259_9ACTN|nr:hypothetical protein [Actinoplanes ferrugineus]GIE12533.1 hypothetical protein Afe05nite_43730 [Actinoplanes ferrugineus]
MGVARGLSIEELATIRAGVDAGRKPRVQFTESAGQIAGQIGQVVSLGDPAESDEFVVVKFGRDELPFSPNDLQVAPRGAVAKKAPPPAPQQAAPVEPEFVLDKPVVPVPAVVPAEPAAVTAAASSAPAPRKATPAKAAKAKPAPALTITLAYGEGEWTVAAAQGSKVLAKPYVVRPAEAMRMVSLVDVQGVQEAVEQILAAERAEAEKEAQRLRAELAEVEARLAELGEAGR